MKIEVVIFSRDVARGHLHVPWCAICLRQDVFPGETCMTMGMSQAK